MYVRNELREKPGEFKHSIVGITLTFERIIKKKISNWKKI